MDFTLHQSNSWSFFDHLYLPPLLRNIFSSNPLNLRACSTPTSRILGEGFFSPPLLSRNLEYQSLSIKGYGYFSRFEDHQIPTQFNLLNNLRSLLPNFKTQYTLQRNSATEMLQLCIVLIICSRRVGRSGVDRASSSDAGGQGFEPRPLHLKKYNFFT